MEKTKIGISNGFGKEPTWVTAYKIKSNTTIDPSNPDSGIVTIDDDGTNQFRKEKIFYFSDEVKKQLIEFFKEDLKIKKNDKN